MDGTQLLKGVLDAAVLAIVAREDGYGYDVVRRLRDAGLEEVGDASVYGTLRRLYAAGALSTYVVPSEGGPHRKYYSITPSGLELLSEQRSSWQRFSETLTQLIAAPAATAAATAAATSPAITPPAITSSAAASAPPAPAAPPPTAVPPTAAAPTPPTPAPLDTTAPRPEGTSA